MGAWSWLSFDANFGVVGFGECRFGSFASGGPTNCSSWHSKVKRKKYPRVKHMGCWVPLLWSFKAAQYENL